MALTPDGKRQIWEIEGDARFDRLDQARFRLSNDPGAEQDGMSSEMRRRNAAISDGRGPAQPGEASRFRLNGDPNGIRTRVTGVKGRCPRPLDDGVLNEPRRIRTFDPRLKRPVLYRLSYGPGKAMQSAARSKRKQAKGQKPQPS